ncbi:hypothetical protein I41_25100 [Lacipirellula limnantheis]|uniref:Uncharacterized protein n=1 Tax=Lacipirellula limnantheis TaxID=2528024 RepID=A0A517TY73_9BACT|nr:hypothetical protein I41_25100 [Lacipirellula limnantheis]
MQAGTESYEHDGVLSRRSYRRDLSRSAVLAKPITIW